MDATTTATATFHVIYTTPDEPMRSRVEFVQAETWRKAKAAFLKVNESATVIAVRRR